MRERAGERLARPAAATFDQAPAGGIPVAVEPRAPGRDAVTIAPGMLAELRAAAQALDDAKQTALDCQLGLDYLTMRVRQAYALKPGDVIDLKTGTVARSPAV